MFNVKVESHLEHEGILEDLNVLRHFEFSLLCLQSSYQFSRLHDTEGLHWFITAASDLSLLFFGGSIFENR